jgi:O-antigen/teichoic acid export membrane protein
MILIGSQIVLSCVGPAGNILTMTGYERIQLVNNLLALGLNIGLNLFLIPRYGILGAAIATSVSLAVLNVLRVIQVIRFIGISPFSTNYFRGIFPVGAGVIVIWALKDVTGFELADVAISVSFGGVVLLLVSKITILSSEDRILIKYT